EHLVEPDAHGHGHLPEWRLIVSPAAGTVRSPTARAGGARAPRPGCLGPGAGGGGGAAVGGSWSLEPAEIIEWLVEDGDPVSEGQPLVRVQLPKGGATPPQVPRSPRPAGS